MDRHLFVSVDMDEWYLARWATGSDNALWPDLESCFQEVYKLRGPIGELYEPTQRILELFDRLSFKSTFFFTGTMAQYYPDLVETVANQGHEIACHNYHHLDYENEPRERFVADLHASKQLLEEISGQEVIGYRSPNSSVPPNLVRDLEVAGFEYDSSITPTRRIFGKFGAFTDAPQHPYRPAYEEIAREGDAKLWEFPWASFPLLKWPAGSGIMHRIAGDTYNAIANWFALSQGHSSYYFHPYEIAESDYLAQYVNTNWKTRVFNRRIGKAYERSLVTFLERHRSLLISGKNLTEICNEAAKNTS